MAGDDERLEQEEKRKKDRKERNVRKWAERKKA